MDKLGDARRDAMGELYNQFVALIDGAALSPPEMIVVLRMLANYVEQLFSASVRGQ
jgi:hypothetical protein